MKFLRVAEPALSAAERVSLVVEAFSQPEELLGPDCFSNRCTCKANHISAARPRRNRRPMRARARMSEERADLVRRFRRENVFELARLLFDLGLAVHRQTIGK